MVRPTHVSLSLGVIGVESGLQRQPIPIDATPSIWIAINAICSRRYRQNRFRSRGNFPERFTLSETATTLLRACQFDGGFQLRRTVIGAELSTKVLKRTSDRQ